MANRVYMSISVRCIDESGGYLHHSPVKAGQIIVTCVCLHNLARMNRMPQPPPEDEEDGDGYRPYRPPLHQPQGQRIEAAAAVETVQSRINFITLQFGRQRWDGVTN